MSYKPIPRPGEVLAASKSGKIALIIAIAVSVGLTLLPFGLYSLIGWPLMLFSTFAHEMGHGLTALLLGGNFQKFVMSPNGAGTAFFSLPAGSPVGGAIVAAGGLVGPAVLAAIFFRMSRTPALARMALRILSGFCFLAVLLVVRNGFGVAYALIVGFTSLLLTGKFIPSKVTHFTVVFLAVQLSICVYTRSDYLFTEWAGPGAPSDVAQMAHALFLPYWFWGGVCAAFSALVLLYGVRGLLKAK